MSTPQYQWVAKSGSNIDVDLLKELSKLIALDNDDFHPLQKRDSQHLQQTLKVKNERNPIKGIEAFAIIPYIFITEKQIKNINRWTTSISHNSPSYSKT